MKICHKMLTLIKSIYAMLLWVDCLGSCLCPNIRSIYALITHKWLLVTCSGHLTNGLFRKKKNKVACNVLLASNHCQEYNGGIAYSLYVGMINMQHLFYWE